MVHSTRSTFTVRSYEVDSYAHLNNGVYLSWYEQGRQDYLKSLGFSYDGFARRKQWFVVGRTEVVFRKALLEGETVELTSSIKEMGRSSVRFLQEMHRVGEPAVVSQSSTTMVFSNDGGSIPIPDDFRSAVEAS
jgi:acyl-CoA thioester hydrolase